MKMAEIIFSLHTHTDNVSLICMYLIFQEDGNCSLIYDDVLIYIKYFNKPTVLNRSVGQTNQNLITQ